MNSVALIGRLTANPQTHAGTRREGLAYWAGAMLLFASEWLWGQPDPGWGAWLAGTTLTVAFSLLIRHDRDLLRRWCCTRTELTAGRRASTPWSLSKLPRH